MIDPAEPQFMDSIFGLILAGAVSFLFVLAACWRAASIYTPGV